MPTYRVTTPEGVTYRIQGPEGATDQDLIFAAKRYEQNQKIEELTRRRAELRAQPPEPPETTFGGNVKEFFKGVIPGAIGLAETAGTGIAAALPEETEKAAREKIKEIAGIAKKPFEAREGYEESVGRRLSEGLGSTLPFFLMGPFGLLGRGAAAGLGVAAGAGEAREAAEAKGATAEERRTATMLGAPTGLLDLLAPNLPGFKSIITTALARGGIEGATEAAQKISQNLIAKGVYDPNQPIVEGAGEEGAYGAGVGALASLILDMTVGRKARQARFGEKPPAEQPPAKQPPPTPALPSTIQPPTAEAPQGELFPAELTQARDEVAKREGPPAPIPADETRPISLRGVPDSEQEVVRGFIQQQFNATTDPETGDLRVEQKDFDRVRSLLADLNVSAPEVRPDRDTETKELPLTGGRTLNQQIIELYAGSQNKKEIERVQEARKKSEEAARAEAEKVRLRFESDLESVNARLQDTQNKTTEQTRMAILLPIIESDTKNIPREFNRQLAANGITNTNLTDAERALIKRVYDIRLATPATPEVEPSAPSELKTLEEGIPEKKETRVPEQMGFPGMGKPKGVAATPAPEAVEEVEAAPSPVLTGDLLDKTGLSKQSGYYKRLINKDMSVPDQQTQVRDVLVDVRSNPNLATSTKQAIERVAMQAFNALAKQGELFGPKGGVITPAPKPKPKPEGKKDEPKQTDKQAGRAGTPSGESTKPSGDTEKSGAPKRDGVGAGAQPAGEAGMRKEAAGDTLKKEAPKKEAPKKEEPKKEEPKKEEPKTDAKRTGPAGPKATAPKLRPLAEHGIYKSPKMLGLRPGAMDFAGLPSGPVKPAPEELQREFALFYQPMHPSVVLALQNGNLQGALDLLGKSHLGRTSQIAKVLMPLMKGVKVELVEDLKNAAGRPLAGSYDYTTNTIRLNADKYMSPHSLLHEATHAAFAKVLGNKSHPAYKQISDLYNTVKDHIDTAYGARSIEDFVSEAFSNPAFQARLAAINTRGEKISAWKRFSNSVTNYLRTLIGLDTKGLNSALDTVDRSLLDLLAPDAQSRGTGVLYQASMLGSAKDVFKLIDDKILSTPAINNQWASSVYELIRNKIPGLSNKVLLRSLPLNALTSVAVQDIPMAGELDTLEKQWSGAIDRRRREADATMVRIQRWLKPDKNKETVLNNVVTTSTLEEVDPSKDRSDYDGQTSKSGAKKVDIWDRLQPQWRSLGEEGQAIYKQMRDTYANYQEDLMGLLFNRIDAAGISKEESKSLKTEIYKRLAVKGKIEPYFPLTRSGGYWLSYIGKGPDGNVEKFVEAFPTSVERELAVKQLEQNSDVQKGSIEKFAQLSQKTYKNAPPTSFVNNVLRILEANKVAPETTDEIMRAFLATLPETSFAQSFRTRKGTLGFNPNAAQAFYGKSISMAHQLANLEYSAKMYKLRDEMETFVKTKNNTDTANSLLTELNNHIRTLVSPSISPLSKTLTSGAFFWTLGGNVSSVIVNSSHVPLVVMPYLGGKYGYPEATKAVGEATRIFFGSGLKRSAQMSGTEVGKDGSKIQMRAGFSFDNYDFDAKNTPESIKELRELASLANEYGLLNRSMMQDLLESGKDETILDKINKYASFLFHHGERMNRQVTMLASYKLALDKMRGKDGTTTPEQRQDAARQAIEETELLNGGASAGSAPLLAKNSLGKVMFMYKRYGVSMYYMLFKTTRDMLAAEDPQVRAAAKRQIAGIYASSALLAGAQGVPMFGIAAVLYNMFKDDDEDDFETAARKYLGEGMFNGALNYITGTAISNRIGLTDLLMQSTGYKDQENIVLSFLQLVGGPVYGVGERMARGAKLISEGEVQRGLEQVSPAAIGNAMKAIRFATEGANTLRGDPIVGEIGLGSAFAQFFGFAPAEYTRQLEINASLKNIERSVIENRTKLLRRYYIATRNGDSEEVADILEKMSKLSEKHPGRAITADTIRTSMAQHMKTSAEMYAGITLDKGLRAELLASAAEFDGDED